LGGGGRQKPQGATAQPNAHGLSLRRRHAANGGYRKSHRLHRRKRR
jgi:hypothetical protein